MNIQRYMALQLLSFLRVRSVCCCVLSVGVCVCTVGVYCVRVSVCVRVRVRVRMFICEPAFAPSLGNSSQAIVVLMACEHVRGA